MRRSPDANFSSESNDPNHKSEAVELYHAAPDHPERILRIGMKLSPRQKAQLKQFLSENLDVFAWSPIDMPWVDPSVICHKLSILPEAKPVKQKPRKLNAERLQALNDEVDRILKADFIRETLYPNWLTNPALMKKKNGK